MDQAEAKRIADIEKYGCHIIHIRAEDDLPPFSYSVGIQRSSGAPEVVVFGLKLSIAGWVINEYNRRVRERGHCRSATFTASVARMKRSGIQERERREKRNCIPTFTCC